LTDCNLTHKNAKDSDDILFPYNQFSNNFLEMAYLFTSESVSEGHPDKIADQISDALIDNFIAFDTEAKVACETLVTTGQVILAGEVKSKVYLDVQQIARDTINRIGYTKSDYMFDGNSCGVLSAIHEQSEDINRGVDKGAKIEQGAGDQGIVFGFATNESDHYMPLTLEISHLILKELAVLRRSNQEITYLRPDAKSQVTILYSDDHQPLRVETVVLSTQHDPFLQDEKAMREKINDDMIHILMPRVIAQLSDKHQKLFDHQIKYHINPTGNFVIGGPHGDTGLTGRKIIVDTYGGRGAHGGGAFSGKDPSKVDRSAAYATRHIAKNLVASGICDQALIQVSYAIGVAEPTSFYVNTAGTAKMGYDDEAIAAVLIKTFDMRPAAIEERLKLRQPIYTETAAYGHMGRLPQTVEKEFKLPDGEIKTMKVDLFTWERLDFKNELAKRFGLA
jgi:S-adenosylmethionine synthetase